MKCRPAFRDVFEPELLERSLMDPDGEEMTGDRFAPRDSVLVKCPLERTLGDWALIIHEHTRLLVHACGGEVPGGTLNEAVGLDDVDVLAGEERTDGRIPTSDLFHLGVTQGGTTDSAHGATCAVARLQVASETNLHGALVDDFVEYLCHMIT